MLLKTSNGPSSYRIMYERRPVARHNTNRSIGSKSSAYFLPFNQIETVTGFVALAVVRSVTART